MGFILGLGLTDVSGRSVKCFSKCVQRTSCISLGCLIKIQIPMPHLCDPLDQNLQGWSLGICILPTSLPPVTQSHSRATGALVLGVWGARGGVERS